MPETAEHTQEHSVATGTSEPTAAPSMPDPAKAESVEGEPAAQESEAAEPEVKKAEPVGQPSDSPVATAGTGPGATRPVATPGKTATAPVTDGEESEAQQKLSELERLEETIGKSESAAKTGAEAAKAANAADARTELAAISREIESDRSKLTEALTTAAARIADAEKRADAAEARLVRESAANREAAAGWVRSQAAEIEADAALAAEIAANPEGTTSTGTAGAASNSRQAELEARIRTLETSLEAEKASKIEALTIAESRLKAIEESAREAEKRVEEAEASLSEAGTAPVSVGAAPGMVTEAEAREAAVVWLRGQIAALRQEISKGDSSDAKGGS